MRKRLITPTPEAAGAPNEGWLDLDGAAVAEVTQADRPILSLEEFYTGCRASSITDDGSPGFCIDAIS
jgi:hypothetical protein